MKYIGKNGQVVRILHEPHKFMRSINVIVSKTFDTNKFLDAIIKEDKNYIKEVRFDHSYRHPDGRLSHTYQLHFEVPGIVTGDQAKEAKLMITHLVAKIEKRLVAECGVVLHNTHDRDEYWARRQS